MQWSILIFLLSYLVTLSLRFELSFPSASGKDWLAEFTTGELNLKDPVLH